MMRSLSRPTILLALLVLLVAATGCDTDDGQPDAADRAQAIQQARAEFGPPATALGSAAVTVEERLTEATDNVTIEAVDEIEAALDDLQTAIDGATEVDAPTPSVDEVAEAQDALDEARSAAERLHEAGRESVGVMRRLANIDAALEELVTTWNAPGSQSEQLVRFGQLADEAEGHVGELEAEAAGVEQCQEPFQRRVEAARFVAEASAELADLIAQRQGEEFDARRAELTEDPYGFGEQLGEAAPVNGSTCEPVATAQEAASNVTEALEALETALNPDDLDD